MSEARVGISGNEVKPFPKGALIGAAMLAALTITAAGFARLTGSGVTDINQSPPAKTLVLNFEDRQDGAITVLDVERGKVLEVLPSGSSGFVRTVMRSMARDRRTEGQGREAPFHLTRWADGRLTIDDPATGGHVDLGAFGSMNTASFARLLEVERPK